MESIFEIKVNEDKIISTFKSIEIKLQSIQQKLVRYDWERKERGIFDGNEEKIKESINQIVLKNIQPLQFTAVEHQNALRNIQYNHNNLTTNIGDDYKLLERKFQESQLHVNRKLAEEQSKNNTNRGRIQDSFSLLKKLVEELEEKEIQQEEELNKIWNALGAKKPKQNNNISYDYQPKPLKKNVAFRHSEIRQNIMNTTVQQQPIAKTRSKFKRQSVRDSILFDNLQQIQQEKTSQYASLVCKVDRLQKQLKEMPHQKSEEKIMVSSKRISNDASQIQIRTIDHQGSQIIQERRSNMPKVQKQSRFRNSIQIQDENQNNSFTEIRSERKSDQRVSVIEEEIKKVNQKLNEFKYKYTLLQQNYDIVLSKISRIGHLQSTIQLKIDEVEKLRVDLTTINEINLRFRRMQSTLEQQTKRYVVNSQYNKEISFLKENVKEIQTYSSKFARNDQIKAAFQFIQAKIKEIVVVITDKFEEDKEGAINKIKQIKCLTCDKEVQGNNILSVGKVNSSHNLSRHLKTRNMKTLLKRINTEGGNS